MVMSSSACCYYAPSSNGIGDIICVRSYCDRSYKIVPTALKTLIPNNLTPSACGIPPSCIARDNNLEPDNPAYAIIRRPPP
jgi:hypothetical protein